MASNPAAVKPPDPLSEVLQDLRLARASYCRAELSAPWGVEMAFQEGVRIHFVVEGRCWLRAAAMDPLLLEQGDVILLPHGTSHDLVDTPDGRTVPWARLGPALVGSDTYHLRAGGGGARALVVCCTVAFEGPTAHPLLEMLPLTMRIKRSEGDPSQVATLLNFMAVEVEQQRIGAATIMARLADIVLARVVRAWAEAPTTDGSGWLAAVKDPQIGLALAAIHRTPGDPWTIERLAAAARLSRSSFARRFGELLGISPGQYLLSWRMQLASVWLRREDLSLSQIADRLGYESYAAFSRAYRRSTGHAPSTSRRRTTD